MMMFVTVMMAALLVVQANVGLGPENIHTKLNYTPAETSTFPDAIAATGFNLPRRDNGSAAANRSPEVTFDASGPRHHPTRGFLRR
uniref:Secreted protein n=1 Tax=Ditylenchus dipsaci TaxID=166011 RepID=A0A915CSG7_9BILA